MPTSGTLPSAWRSLFLSWDKSQAEKRAELDLAACRIQQLRLQHGHLSRAMSLCLSVCILLRTTIQLDESFSLFSCLRKSRFFSLLGETRILFTHIWPERRRTIESGRGMRFSRETEEREAAPKKRQQSRALRRYFLSTSKIAQGKLS